MKRGGNVCVCGSCCNLRTVPHSLLRCGWCWWCSCSCCLGGIVVNLRCFLLIIFNFSFLFLLYFLEGNQYKFIPFSVLFFVVLLMSDVCLSAFLLLLLLLRLLLPAPENKLTPHTYHHTQSLCECVCVSVCVCVRFTFSLLCCYSQWHNGTRRTELN